MDPEIPISSVPINSLLDPEWDEVVRWGPIEEVLPPQGLGSTEEGGLDDG
jgi:hypothetical protein